MTPYFYPGAPTTRLHWAVCQSAPCCRLFASQPDLRIWLRCGLFFSFRTDDCVCVALFRNYKPFTTRSGKVPELRTCGAPCWDQQPSLFVFSSSLACAARSDNDVLSFSLSVKLTRIRNMKKFAFYQANPIFLLGQHAIAQHSEYLCIVSICFILTFFIFFSSPCGGCFV